MLKDWSKLPAWLQAQIDGLKEELTEDLDPTLTLMKRTRIAAYREILDLAADEVAGDFVFEVLAGEAKQ